MNWYKWQHMLEETRTAEAEVAPVEAAGREPWQYVSYWPILTPGDDDDGA